MTTTNLINYKKTKKLKKVVTDLAEIQKLMSLTIHGFSTYKKYTPVKEVLNSLVENKVMIDVYLKKFKKSLEELNENKLE